MAVSVALAEPPQRSNIQASTREFSPKPGHRKSPFGPLRLAYGFNLDPRAGEKNPVFEFSVGSLF